MVISLSNWIFKRNIIYPDSFQIKNVSKKVIEFLIHIIKTKTKFTK